MQNIDKGKSSHNFTKGVSIFSNVILRDCKGELHFQILNHKCVNPNESILSIFLRESYKKKCMNIYPENIGNKSKLFDRLLWEVLSDSCFL